jgi:hypothetical protein
MDAGYMHMAGGRACHMVATCLRSVRTTAAVGEFPHGTAAISIFGKSGQPLLVQAVPINPGELNKVTVQ